MTDHLSLSIDPSDILGVSREASIQEIRDAYRAKSKKYHPDTGGEEWAFRILVQAYEVMCTTRVVRATHREFNSSYHSPEPCQPSSGAAFTTPEDSGNESPLRGRPKQTSDGTEWVRPGFEEPASDPSRVVDVEKMTVLYEADQIWLITDRSSENRFLSCSLNITWPDPDARVPPSSFENAEKIRVELQEVFDLLCVQSRTDSSSASILDGHFSGWVSYSSSDRASSAFNLLRQLLHGAGLSVKRWSRDLIIPRKWR